MLLSEEVEVSGSKGAEVHGRSEIGSNVFLLISSHSTALPY